MHLQAQPENVLNNQSALFFSVFLLLQAQLFLLYFRLVFPALFLLLQLSVPVVFLLLFFLQQYLPFLELNQLRFPRSILLRFLLLFVVGCHSLNDGSSCLIVFKATKWYGRNNMR